MACNATLRQRVCQTIQISLTTGQIISRTVSCGQCPPPLVSIANNVLTVRLTFDVPFQVSISDNLTATCTPGAPILVLTDNDNDND